MMRKSPAVTRRGLAGTLLAGVIAARWLPAREIAAQPATPVTSPVTDLARLFPPDEELPAGLTLEGAGTRDAVAQVAGTFRNARDAAALLAGWGWAGNAYRSYVAGPEAGPGTPARVELSLHQFASGTGAAYALAYLAHDRAVALQQQADPTRRLQPCEATVTGPREATRYLRQGPLVVRSTVVMPTSGARQSRDAALVLATDLALAVLSRAGRGPLEPSGDCG